MIKKRILLFSILLLLLSLFVMSGCSFGGNGNIATTRGNETNKTDVNPSTDPVTDPSTNPVTDPSTVPSTEPKTEPSTEPTTDPVTDPVTDDPTVIDLSGVWFANASYYADGHEKELTVIGELPNGVSVTYSNNKLTKPGKVTATAVFSKAGCEDIVKTATLTLYTYPYYKGIMLSDKVVEYDGNTYSLSIQGTLPEGVTVTYSGNGKSQAGEYAVTAYLSGDGVPDDLPGMTAALIIRPAQYDMSGVKWNYSEPIEQSGEKISVSVSGLPQGVEVTYSGNEFTLPGAYTATATFSSTNPNYKAPDTMTLQWVIRPPISYAFSVQSGNADLPAGQYAPGTVVHVTPQVETDFLCWSNGSGIVSGGAFISSEKNLTLTLVEDTVLIPNYKTSEIKAVVLYDLNGGVLAPGGENTAKNGATISANAERTKVSTTFSNTYYLMYTTIVDNGTFVRDGYTLLEYVDSEGVPVNPGGKARIRGNGLIQLKAIWGKWSDASNFTWEISADKTYVTITSYIADEETVIIPEVLGGLPVKAIAAGAFVNKNFVTLSAPRGLTSFAKGAFVNCNKFDKFYLCDTVSEIYNDTFQNCRAFTQFCLNAGRLPASPTGEPAFTHKMELIIEMTADRDILVVMSGSSSLYGFDAHLMEDILTDNGYNYFVINYGTNQGSNGAVYMEAASHFMNKGDIMISASEYGGVQYGSHVMAWKTYRATETMYNMFRYIDASAYTNLFGGLIEWNVTNKRLDSKGSAQNGSGSGQDDRGYTKGNASHSNFSYTKNSLTISAGTLSESAVKGFNRVHKLLVDAGVTVYFTFSPYVLEGFNQDKSDIAGYVNAIQTKLLYCTLISFDVMPFMIPYEKMCNSTYHPTAEGATIRTTNLTSDLLAQFEKEKAATQNQ